MVEKQGIKHLILKMLGLLFVILAAYYLVTPIKLELVKPDDKEILKIKMINCILEKKIDSLETIIMADSSKIEYK